MEKFFFPYFDKHSARNSLLILDNHGSHVTDIVTETFDENDIKYFHFAPNTPICQPVDVEVGAVIKAKIKSYFEEWIVEGWETDNFAKYNAKKNKYTYQASNKALIIE